MAGRVFASNLWKTAAVAAALMLGGCGSLIHRHDTHAVPYTTQPPHDSVVNEQARLLNKRGLHAFEIGNLLKAEQLFREALEADVNFGPAHNNLGQVYLARHQLYLAAWEFEYAANLMPELVEPIINQGLAYETGERLERAAEIYQDAYSRLPSHPVAIASLVRCKVKLDADPYEIAFLLDELIMHDGRREWVEWAKELRATKYRNDCLECGEHQSHQQFDDQSSDRQPSLGRDEFDRESDSLRRELLPMTEPVPGRPDDESTESTKPSVLLPGDGTADRSLGFELPPIPNDVTQGPRE